jgi:hypothetical protein
MMSDRWSYLSSIERQFLQEAIVAYDRIMSRIEDTQLLSNLLNLDQSDLDRSKNYAFGEGVRLYEFIPEILMAQAWERLVQGQGTEIDLIFLQHELYESDLVINYGYPPQKAHELAQRKISMV